VLSGEGFMTYRVPELVPLIGAGSRTLISRAFAAAHRTLEPERLDALHAAFLAYYEDHLADQTRPYPGVEAALEQFERAGFVFAVCTNKIEAAARKLLEALGLAGRFRFICGQDTFKAAGERIAKPNPQTYRLTIERAGGDFDRSFMVGDSRTDIETAKAAERPVIAVDFGYSDRPIAEYAPDLVISSFEQLWPAARSLALA
jgi:phosphoglycolate phosphatase